VKIVVTSQNPVKIQATKAGFSTVFPRQKLNITSISVPSGVRDQPISADEAFKGAKHRVEQAVKNVPDANFWVGIEGGVELINEEMEAFAWIYIRGKNGKIGKAKSGTFLLPAKIVNLIQQGKELGEADDIVFNQKNSKQKKGAVGTLTRNAIDRTEYYVQSVILALIPFLNPDLY